MIARMLRSCCCLVLTVALCVGTSLRARAGGAETLTLEDAVNRALRTAPSLVAAGAQSDMSEARINETGAQIYPSISAGAEYNQTPGYDQTITNRGLTLAQLMLSYTAFDGGRGSAQMRSARYAAEAAAFGVKAVRAQIVFDTTVAYFDLMRAREGETELQADRDRLTSYVAVIEALRRSGRAIANDVLKLRATHDVTALSLLQARQAAAHASLVLGSMIGNFEAEGLQVADMPIQAEPPIGDVAQSPLIKAAQRQVEAAKLAVAAARAERSPTVKLALSAGWEGIDPPKTFGRRLGASYDGVISLPLFQGGLVQSHVDQALAAQRAAAAQMRQVEVGLKRDLADASMRYRGARAQLDLLTRTQATADDAFALAWTRFLGGGNITLLEVIDAYQQAQTLRLARFDAQFAARQASAQAALIMGLPL